MKSTKPSKSIKQIGNVTRRSIQVSGSELVKLGRLDPAHALPTLIEPAVEGVDLAAWAGSHRELIEEHLTTAGGVLFRGFRVHDEMDLERLIEAVSGELLEYSYRSTPRTQVHGNIYTSTEYPADQHIPMHNEMAYTTAWPMKIFFLCALNAEEGGETPIADSRRIYERIPVEVRQRFAAHGVMYLRNYGGGLDLPWEEVFQTADRAQVEAFCAQRGISLEWFDDGRLRTRQVCQAVARHPRTGDTVWFNQAHLFHVTSLDPETRESLLADYGEEGVPRNTFFGDGSPIPPADLDAVRAVFEQELVVFPWRNGDLMVLDNMLAAHGRRPYRGPRRILVGMSETFSEQDAA